MHSSSLVAKLITLFSFLSLFFAASVTASPLPDNGAGTNVSQCNTGPVQCCNSVQDAGDGLMPMLLGLLGVVVGANVPIGVTCSPISIAGTGQGATCTASPVCCEDNSSSLISVGCIPISAPM